MAGEHNVHNEHIGTRPGVLGLWAERTLGRMIEEVCSLEGYNFREVGTADEAIAMLEHDNQCYIIAMDNIHSSSEAERLLQVFPSRPELRSRVRVVGMMANHRAEYFSSGPLGSTLDAIVIMPFTFDEFIQVIEEQSASLQGDATREDSH